MELMDQVFRILGLRVQETAEGLHIEGAILLPGDGSDVPLPLAVGGELRTEVPRDPLPKFTAIELPFVLVVGHDSGGGEA